MGLLLGCSVNFCCACINLYSCVGSYFSCGVYGYFSGISSGSSCFGGIVTGNQYGSYSQDSEQFFHCLIVFLGVFREPGKGSRFWQ